MERKWLCIVFKHYFKSLLELTFSYRTRLAYYFITEYFKQASQLGFYRINSTILHLDYMHMDVLEHQQVFGRTGIRNKLASIYRIIHRNKSSCVEYFEGIHAHKHCPYPTKELSGALLSTITTQDRIQLFTYAENQN